jgi:TolB-like protein
LFNELKRRNVIRVAVAYLVASWLLIEASSLILDIYEAPLWVSQVLVAVLAIGFPIALIFAWVFELTPDGLKRESEIAPDATIVAHTARKLDVAVIVLLIAAMSLFGAERSGLLGSTADEPQPVPTVAEVAVAEDVALTIAVLPFVNMSGDEEQEYFADGLTEELLNVLAKIPELQVVARTSTFAYKGEDQDIRQIGRELGAGSIVEGSVRRDGNRIRVTAQLIRTEDGIHLWSDRFDRELVGIFEIQEDISEHIASALQLSLGVEAAVSSIETVDMVAYDHYLRASNLYRMRRDFVAAIEHAEAAVAQAPEYAPAWALLSQLLFNAAYYLDEPEFAALESPFERGLAAGQRAMELAPRLPSAMVAVANFYRLDGRWAESLELYQRALEIDPDSGATREDYSETLQQIGRTELAYQIGRPIPLLEPNSGVAINMHARAARKTGRIDEAERLVRRVLELAPEPHDMTGLRVAGAIHSGDLDALEGIISDAEAAGGTMASDMRVIASWRRGERGFDDEVLAAIDRGHLAALGVEQLPLFFELWGTRSTVNRIYFFPAVIDPMLPDAFLDSEEVLVLAESVGLVDYWREHGLPDVCADRGRGAPICQIEVLR